MRANEQFAVLKSGTAEAIGEFKQGKNERKAAKPKPNFKSVANAKILNKEEYKYLKGKESWINDMYKKGAAKGHEKYGGEFPFLSKIKKKYNRSKKDSRSEERPILNRVALHARALEYMPFEGTEPKMIECPESNDLLKFTEKLEKYSS